MARASFGSEKIQRGHFLNRTHPDRLFVTDFTLHSICLILNKLNRKDALLLFMREVFVGGGVNLIHLEPEDTIHLEPEDTNQIFEAIEKFNLDFDDAYQYVAAEKRNLTIISFDTDFDRTEHKRKKPSEVKSEIKNKK